ncbi:hypothetical protein ACP4OV_014948 [Aristida adscensionis]
MAGGEGGGGEGGGVEPLHETPMDIMYEILLCLPSRSSLMRVVAACDGFHTLVTSPRFLRRHRTWHQEPACCSGSSIIFSLCPNGAGGNAAFHPADSPHVVT